MKQPKQMKTIFIHLCLFIFCVQTTIAQNLVINSNFSSNLTPKAWSDFSKTNDWNSPTSATPDLYAKAATNKEVTIPMNVQGNQEPVDGNNYAGIIAYQSESEISRDGLVFSQKTTEGVYTEYIQGKLNTALTAGTNYSIEIKLSLSESSSYAINNIGASFSETEMKSGTNSYLKVEPQFLSKEVIKSNDWVSIKGTFKAKGNEKYFIVGSWNKDRTVEELKKGGTHRAYYYIGSVNVSGAAPKDSDKDGIADEDDKCPTVFGVKTLEGCPDADGDGITDSEDKCPNQVGDKDNNGCPVVAVTKNNDKDKDGIADEADKCPDVKGTKEFMGCPDTDNDGIADNEDKCPTTPGITENAGCPEVKAEVLAVFERALQGIQFETGKDVIKPSSYGILDEVVLIMKENTSYSLDINGHTDNAGNAKANKVLSQKRAAAVEKYLVKKGVSDKRLSPYGFGPDQPIDSNDTPEGKSRNRRVEFKVK
jgi:outer membrane protein OmpA-like peptidoglycan-associated protein